MRRRKFSGTRVREFRESVPLTQTELALMSGVSVRAIAYTESGERIPGGAILGKLSRALGVRVIDFWTYHADDVAS